MVNFYCRACGLYISVPAEYAGGRGVCPRCKTPLRIPRPLPGNHPDYVDGLRYLADLFDANPAPPSERPVIVNNTAGPSSRFKCRSCGREFESLKPTGRHQGQCPNCNTINNAPVTASVEFPRHYASEHQPTVSPGTDETGWGMDGDFLVAPRSENQDPSDSIIQGLPLHSGDLEAPGTALNGVQKCAPDIEAQLAASLSPDAGAKPAKDTRRWFYLLREHQHGPVSTTKLQELIRGGNVGLSVLVFHEGLKGWRPIEEFEELRQCASPDRASEPIAPAQPSSGMTAHELRREYQKFLYLLWLFITAGSIFTLGLVMKQTLIALGQKFFVYTNLILSCLIFLCLLYGILLLLRKRDVFRRAPFSVRLRTWIGFGGLVACMVTTLVLPLTWRNETQIELDERSIYKAQEIFLLLREGDVKKTYGKVDWQTLRVNGREYGERFKNTNSQEDRQALMDSVCNVFLEAFSPYFNRKELYYPGHLDSWRILRRGAGDTMVEVRIPSTERVLHFTLRANRLIALDVI